MRPEWEWPREEKSSPDPPGDRWIGRITLTIGLGAAFLAICLYGCLSRVQGQEHRSAVAPVMIPPLPAAVVPLRPILSQTNRIVTLTNANGDLIVHTTVVIPRRVEPRRHYYGVINSEMNYLGEWSYAEYEKWAYTGSQATANQPEIARWNCVFALTNRVDLPALIHVKLCP